MKVEKNIFYTSMNYLMEQLIKMNANKPRKYTESFYSFVEMKSYY